MSTIYIGSARIDENGNTTGGEAGDQTGKEVSTQVMYTHSKGWYVYRPTLTTVANLFAKYMLRACNNKNVGYDQNNRLAIIKDGTDSTTPTECDCSSLIRRIIIEATGTDPGNFNTSTEPSKLEATGLFETKFSYVSQSKTPVYNGDILVTKTKGHTAIVVSGNERSSSSSSTTTTKVTVDGAWGPKTTQKCQTVLGTTVDGIVSNQLKAYVSYLEAADTDSWEFSSSKKGGSEMMKALQKKIGATSDGYAGPKTVKALQTFVGVTSDGKMGKQTVKAFQRWLNKQ